MVQNTLIVVKSDSIFWCLLMASQHHPCLSLVPVRGDADKKAQAFSLFPVGSSNHATLARAGEWFLAWDHCLCASSSGCLSQRAHWHRCPSQGWAHWPCLGRAASVCHAEPHGHHEHLCCSHSCSHACVTKEGPKPQNHKKNSQWHPSGPSKGLMPSWHVGGPQP